MLKPITDKESNELVTSFNDKIAIYNKLASQNSNEAEKLQFLYEINHLHTLIKRAHIDNYLVNDYDGIISFPGIGGELTALGLPNVQGVAAADVLSANLQSTLKIPTIQEWDKISKKSERAASLSDDIAKLDTLALHMLSTPSDAQAKEYFYSLKHIKNKILDNLIFSSDYDRRLLVSLLHRVNSEIESVKKQIPNEVKRTDYVNSVSQSALIQELTQLSISELDELSMRLKQPGVADSDIAKLLPSVSEYNVTRLGGSNNINWKISNPETGVEFVLQAVEPTDNQLLLKDLELSSANSSLATTSFFSPKSLNSFYAIAVTELCTGGDLKNEREKLKEASTEQILEKAASRIQELTHFCQLALKNNVMHSDIKLTNFLINSEGALVVADKKALTKVDENGYVPIGRITTTQECQPPENVFGGPKTVNAQSFMSYQIGLALYDYLVLPAEATNNQERSWSQSLPLKFDAPIFQTPQGMALEKLITDMLNPDPQKRPSLDKVQAVLQQVCPLNTSARVNQSSNTLSSAYEYRTRNIETSRTHSIELVGKNFQDLKEGFKELRSDVLKTAILDDIKSKIGKVSSLDELQKLKSDFEKTGEYKVLATAQDRTTKVLQQMGLKNTTSINTLESMFSEQERNISDNAPTSHRLD